MPFITKLGAVAARAYGWIATTVSAAVNDTYFYLVALLLPGNGTNGAQNNTFLDSSTNNFTITRNGNTTQGTFSPFSQTGWSNYFDGSGDYLSIASNAAFNFGTGDFTIEFWLFLPSPSTTQVFLDIRNAGVGLVFYSSGGVLYVNKDNSGSVLITGSSLTGFTWLHVALSRSGGANRLFINGVQSGNTVTDSTNYPTNPVYIGGNFSGGQLTTGYISNLRIVKGVALYTNSFTPPATPLTAVSGTSLLTCQSNRLIDNSVNNFTLTKGGDVAVQAFSPFAPNNISPTSYSGWFDGSGDYLTLANNAALNPGTGDFTIEAWIYLTTIGTAKSIISTYNNAPTNYWDYQVKTTNVLELSTVSGTVVITGVTALALGQWYHIAVTRSGTTVRQFINGILDASSTSSANLTSTNSTAIAATVNNINNFAGAISNLRVVKGTAVYTSNFTPPTVPLTAIANTSLLTLQNATFIDNSTNAFTITANGNAQPITTNPFQTPSPNPISYSGYFDGTGDYLSATIPSIALGTSAFTMEAWVWVPSSGSGVFSVPMSSIAVNADGANERGVFLSINNSYLKARFGRSVNGEFDDIDASTNPVSANQWNHIALVRENTSTNGVKLYLNGTRVVQGTSAISLNKQQMVIGRSAPSFNGEYYTGYISNARWVNSAVYTGNFIPSNTPLTAVSGTSLLTCQDNRFVDNSTNAFAITVNGNTTPVMTNPYGYATPISSTAYSGAFDGSGDYLTIPSNAALTFGTGDFCYEFWVFHAVSGVVETYADQTANGFGFAKNTANKLELAQSGVAVIMTSVGTVPINQWVHVAVTRSGTSVRMFINGTLDSTATLATNFSAASVWYVSRQALAAVGYITGYISNLRAVKGTAVYTAAFTPSTTPLTAIANTSLLTCQNIVFADNSSNAFTVTVNGNTAPTPVNPFGYSAPATPTSVSYSALTNGGSGYFDGSGDYLIFPQNAAFNLTTSDFTVDGWVYYTSTPAAGPVFSIDTTSYPSLLIQNESGVLKAYATSASLSWDILNGMSFGSISANTWAHFALTRSGSTFRTFLNGALVTTVTSSASIENQGGTGRVGASDVNVLLGYLSNFRVIKGTALYASNFAPPTAPVTAVSNTQLLLNYTNAGIADAASQNVLETVGNAQISTAQSKWGGGSMAFDGTGDYLTVPDSPAWFLSTGNFTIELWIYFSSTASLSMLVQQGLNINNRWILYYSTTTGMSFDVASAAATLITCQQGSTAGWATNTWYHVAVVRNGNAFNIYRNGTSIASATDTDSIPDFAGPLYIGGGAFSGDVSLNGYIDDLRITKFARYTANFTPPTAAFPTQ